MPPGLQAGEAPKKINAEFSVSSSLPPMVTGALAGEVEVSVTYLYLKAGVLRPARYLRGQSQGGSLFAVRMQWWGDRGPGTVLTPALLEVRDEKGDSARRAALSDANCALFPVRCGLDGLVAYLNDMVSCRVIVLLLSTVEHVHRFPDDTVTQILAQPRDTRFSVIDRKFLCDTSCCTLYQFCTKLMTSLSLWFFGVT